MERQQEFVLRTIEERDIRFVRLWFTDVLGFLKSVAVAPAELEGAFAEGIGFDGSAIEGFARVHESDMLARPDPQTFQVLPWRGEAPGTARMFCDILMPDGAPSYADPRHVLRRVMQRAADLGFTFYVHPEVEFFLLRGRPSPDEPLPAPIDAGGYFDQTPHDLGHDFRRQAITMLERMGISVEFSHHEVAPGQQEIDLRYADALTTADNLMTMRLVVKEVALEQGIYASFMPKPYLLFAVLLAAGLKGIEEGYELPDGAEDDVWQLTDGERRAMGIAPLPGSLSDAITALESSELMAETLGEHVFDFFLRNKRAEWEAYRQQVTPFELSRYLPVL